MIDRIDNRRARWLWLAANGLQRAPTGPLDVMSIIKDLGFLQIDTIRNVTRAHNHIIWTRNQNFREGQLWPLLKRRQLFEHFTHDASLLPMETYPYWQRQFRRMGHHVARSDWYKTSLAVQSIEDIRQRIETEGPLSTHAFDTKVEGNRQMWARPPHKRALDQMWYAGVMATSHRDKFVKFYDLGERVFPTDTPDIGNDAAQIDWLCDTALDKLGMASMGEVQRFWGAMDAAEARAWGQRRKLRQIDIEGADRTVSKALVTDGFFNRLENVAPPTSRLRILNPFDPAIRDRVRLKRLFGFDYRNEMFVPKAKRVWGYYVYPLLEKDRFVGRVELKADRKSGVLSVTGFWPEPSVDWPNRRMDKLDAELARLARFAGVATVAWQVDRKS